MTYTDVLYVSTNDQGFTEEMYIQPKKPKKARIMNKPRKLPYLRGTKCMRFPLFSPSFGA